MSRKQHRDRHRLDLPAVSPATSIPAFRLSPGGAHVIRMPIVLVKHLRTEKRDPGRKAQFGWTVGNVSPPGGLVQTTDSTMPRHPWLPSAAAPNGDAPWLYDPAKRRIFQPVDIPSNVPARSPEALAQAIVKDGLADYFKDAHTVNYLVDWIADETHIPKLAVRAAFRILVPIVLKAADSGGSWVASQSLRASYKVLARFESYRRVAVFLTDLKTRLASGAQAGQALKAVLDGERKASEIIGLGQFSDHFRLSLKVLEDQEQLLTTVEGFGAEISDNLTKIRSDLTTVLDRLNPQPPLDNRLRTGEGISRWVFGVRAIPFFGRHAELTALEAFLEDERNALWWTVTGPGGVGKSRLALELCLRQSHRWRCGFLPDSDASDWQQWEPEQDTLIIIDYASARPDDVRAILDALHLKRDQFAWRVRVLLIERAAEGPWWDTVSGTGSSQGATAEIRYDSEVLEVSELAPDELWEIVEAVFHRAGKTSTPPRDETLAGLSEIDSGGRPLFAALTAAALAENENIRTWDRNDLLGHILAREKKRWQDNHFSEADKNLLALATMTGGLRLADIEYAALVDAVGAPPTYDPQHQALMTGRDGTEALGPLEPDIVGEFFVLEHLKPAYVGDTSRAARFRKAAWTQSPLGTAVFLDRCGRDFTDHESLSLIVETPPPTAIGIILWSVLAVNLISAYHDAERLDDARALYDTLAALARDHADEPEVRLEQAKGAINLITALRSNDSRDEAVEIARNASATLTSDEFREFLHETFGTDGAQRIVAMLDALIAADISA